MAAYTNVPGLPTNNRQPGRGYALSTASQKAALAAELEEQFAIEAEKRRLANLKQNQDTDSVKLHDREKGQARKRRLANLKQNTDSPKLDSRGRAENTM